MRYKRIMTKRISQIFCLMVIMAGLAVFGSLVPHVWAGEYKIGPGDVLDISVWQNPDLTRKVVVLPDGTISFPLAGEITVEGLTVADLEATLVSSLEKYVTDPILTVSVSQTNSMMIYIIGQVRAPGRFLIQDDINVLQALSLAGGLNAFADEKEIQVFRKNGQKPTLFEFNYKEVEKGENLEQNITLQRGDVIVVK